MKSVWQRFLPPANEVWGKVIFLHLFVILFTGGACMVAPGGDVWLLLWGGCAWLLRGGVHGCSEGSCVVALGGHVWLLRGDMCGCSGGHAWDTARYGDTVNERAVCILLECILVMTYFYGNRDPFNTDQQLNANFFILINKVTISGRQ